MAIDGTLPINWVNNAIAFTVTNTTVCKVLVPPSAPLVVTAVTGETALPYETAVRQRVQQGGCLVIDGLITSSDASARNLVMYTGNQTTLFANMGAPTITGTNTVNRTVGSFVTDGYLVGMTIMCFGDTVQVANNGILLIVTGVTSLTITVSGTPLTNETSAAGFYMVIVAQTTNKAIAANSGNNGTVPSIALIGGLLEPRTQNNPYGIELGATGMIIVGMAANISALPAVVAVSAHYGLY